MFVEIGDELNESNQKDRQKKTTSSRKKSKVEPDSDSNSSLASSFSGLSSVSTRRSSSVGKTIEPVKPKSGQRLYKYLCKKCGFGSDLQIGFSQHCKNTHEEIVHYCEVNNCDYFFFSQNGLRNHAKVVHASELSCGICSSISLTPRAWPSMFQSIVIIQNWDAQLVSRLLQGFMTGTNISRIHAPKILIATFFASTVMTNAQVQKLV